MATRTVAGRQVEITAEGVVAALDGVQPEPLHTHYVVVGDRRYPPKQALEAVTGIDRSDFTTHHARRILQRAGLGVGRQTPVEALPFDRSLGPHGGREAVLLEPFKGRWVAQRDLRVLVDAGTPQEVMAWLRVQGERDAVVFRVPAEGESVEGLHAL